MRDEDDPIVNLGKMTSQPDEIMDELERLDKKRLKLRKRLDEVLTTARAWADFDAEGALQELENKVEGEEWRYMHTSGSRYSFNFGDHLPKPLNAIIEAPDEETLHRLVLDRIQEFKDEIRHKNYFDYYDLLVRSLVGQLKKFEAEKEALEEELEE